MSIIPCQWYRYGGTDKFSEVKQFPPCPELAVIRVKNLNPDLQLPNLLCTLDPTVN